MNFIEEAFEWAVNRTAFIMEWIGSRVMPLWDRLICSYDLSVMLGMFLLVVAAVVCAIVSVMRHDFSGLAGKEEEETEKPSGFRARWKRWRHPKDIADSSDWGAYYSIICKCFYYPMVIYFFMGNTPFLFEHIPLEETIFFQFREVTDGLQFVFFFLMIRFVAVVISDVLRLRFIKLLKFFLYNAASIIAGTWGFLLMRWMGEVSETNLLLKLVFVVVWFLVSTLPMVYFWICMFLPLYQLVMPLLTPFAILFGIVKTALDEEESFFTWVRDNHFFLWLQFFVDR